MRDRELFEFLAELIEFAQKLSEFSLSKRTAERVFRPFLTFLFKITTRMTLLFSNYFGDYSYSFGGSFELSRITVVFF